MSRPGRAPAELLEAAAVAEMGRTKPPFGMATQANGAAKDAAAASRDEVELTLRAQLRVDLWRHLRDHLHAVIRALHRADDVRGPGGGEESVRDRAGRVGDVRGAAVPCPHIA